jgi:ABC-type antimicrobial peptide transport system permease subunit
MALGARPSNVVWFVMREVLTIVVIGLAIGVPIAVGIERLMSSVLFGLSQIDPVSVSLAVALLLGVGGLAAYLPARRASRVDPMTALRYE